jgi:hypothetical protein
MTRFARILAELSDPTDTPSPFALASLADCDWPDSVDSPGAVFLVRVARDVAEWVGQWDTPDDARDALSNFGDQAHEIADSAIPVYTHERWQTFDDLAAWREDISEYGGTDDLTNAAGVALYMIAERLVRALAEELAEALDEDDEEQDERPDGSTVYFTRDPDDGYYTATTSNGTQIGPDRFETIEDARAYLAELDDDEDNAPAMRPSDFGIPEVTA